MSSTMCVFSESPLPQGLRFQFPLPRPHTGVCLGNGRFGLLVWGGDRQLHLTVAVNGFWDRRGATPFAQQINFSQVLEFLAAGDEQRVRDAFRPTGDSAISPTQLPDSADFDPDDGSILVIRLRDAQSIRIQIAHRPDVAHVLLPESIRDAVDVKWVSTWNYTGNLLSERGYRPPVDQEHRGVRLQTLAPPSDDPLTVGVFKHDAGVSIMASVGRSPQDLASDLIAACDDDNRHRQASQSADWWSEFRRDVPFVDLPDAALMQAYDYALYRFAALTHPDGRAATLQGPWMEEYQLPPWSNDYHFNINLQLCYWPALSCNRTAHLRPLWDLIRSWIPALRENADLFFGSDACALMLPHAVDDRCQAIGTFWQGTMDHASTAWVAQLAWLHYQHDGDTEVLRDVAWPLLNGAFNGFWAMLRGEPDGPLSLPVSVSPEFGEGAPGTWGRDASFQLAAVHAVARALQSAAIAMNAPTDPRWQSVLDRLPAYCAIRPHGTEAPIERIAIWQGQDLTFSHRHHSHLAGVWPFATLDYADPERRALLEQSMNHWTSMGAGQWSAWCLPWASILCSRTDRPDAALAWLKWLIENCSNEGHAIGISGALGAMNNWCGADDARRKPGEHFEIMQLDAHMGLIVAVHELLVYSVAGEIRVLPRIPWRWKDLQFDRIGTIGGVRVGATVSGGQVSEVRLLATRDGPIRVRLPFDSAWRLLGTPICAEPQDNLFLANARAGQKFIFQSVHRSDR
jgi:alpha-L-fucosidase 2